MTDSPPGQSMEAILASIKRIIADPSTGSGIDRPAPDVAAAEPPARATWRPEDDVLELGGAMTAGPAPVSAPLSDPVAHDQAAPPVAPALVSIATRDASARAMAALSTVTIDPAAAANSLDGLVRELLRPMLGEWLDAHLPDLVERVVAREVARLGGR